MTDLEAYEACRKAMFSRKRRLASRYGVEPEDASHNIWIKMKQRGDFDRPDGWVYSKLNYCVTEEIREKIGRKRYRKLQPKPIHLLDESRLRYNQPESTGLVVEELREMQDGRFKEMIDALLDNHFEQKAAARQLGVSQPAVSQRFKTLATAANEPRVLKLSITPHL